MNKLKKQAESLANKATWIRHGLKDFMEKWADETGENLIDNSIQYEDFGFSMPEFHQWGSKTFYLARGESWIAHRYYEAPIDIDDYAIDIDTIDMECLKKIINELPAVITRHSDRLKEAGKEYENILRILNI